MGRRRRRLVLMSAASVLLLSSCSTSSLEKRLRFGWPTGVTKQAERMRVLWTWSSLVALIVAVITWSVIFYCCIRFRKRDDAIPRQTKYNLPIELTYTILPFLIVAALFFFTYRAEEYVDKTTANPDAVVQVTAFKWNWQFNYVSYHGAKSTYDGTTTALSTVGSSGEIPILLVPRGQTVRVVEHSADVIHSFWVPEFLFKRDVIPYGDLSGKRDNQFEFTATSTGSFVGRCAELCGTYHSQMNFEVRVVDPDVYQRYLDALKAIGPTSPSRQADALKAIGLPEYATTTTPFNTTRGQLAK